MLYEVITHRLRHLGKIGQAQKVAGCSMAANQAPQATKVLFQRRFAATGPTEKLHHGLRTERFIELIFEEGQEPGTGPQLTSYNFV